MALHFLVWLGSEPDSSVRWLALLLTYSAHLALCSAATGLLVRRQSLSSATRHLLWKLALFAPLATTFIAVAAPPRLADEAGDAPHYRDMSVVSLDDAEPSGDRDGAPSASPAPLIASGFGALTLFHRRAPRREAIRRPQ